MSADSEKTRETVAGKDDMVRALLVERAGYVRRGLSDRVGQVDEQLKARGCPTDGLPAVSREAQSADSAPRGRRSAKSTTAEGDSGE